MPPGGVDSLMELSGWGTDELARPVAGGAPLAYTWSMADKVFITVVETPAYLRQAERLLSEAEREVVVSLVGEDPECGVVLRGTGGVRKVRVAREGGGKSGGFRVIYFFHDLGMPVYLLSVFAKNEKANLTRAETNALHALTSALVRAHKEGRHE